MTFGQLSLAAALLAAPVADDERAEVERFRARREADLKADDGWLTLVGLHWLAPGSTRLGSDPTSDVLLPASTPASVGTLTLDPTGRATLAVEPGVAITVDGRPFSGVVVRSDADGEKPDVLALGDVRIILIKRGARYALRVKDNTSPRRAGFAGLRWYSIDPSWRLSGTFEPHPGPTKLVMETIVGEPEVMESAGFVRFDKDGTTYRLQAARSGDKLWLVFRDATSGRTTHPGARTLTLDPPSADGAVIVDFNKAVNLPCAFNPFATCPLAPRQNRLTIPIAAGELAYEPGPTPTAP